MTNIETLIEAVENAYSAPTLIKAVRELAAAGSEEAIPTLIKVLGYNNPGAAVAAVDGLVALGEVAVPSLLASIDGYDYGARAWSHRALSQIGDPRALETLLEAASQDFALSVRRAATKGLGSLSWQKLPPEEVPNAQKRVLETLMNVKNDPEWVVRYAAVVGLQSLGMTVKETQPDVYAQILIQLKKIGQEDPELAVQARGKMALQMVDS